MRLDQSMSLLNVLIYDLVISLPPTMPIVSIKSSSANLPTILQPIHLPILSNQIRTGRKSIKLIQISKKLLIDLLNVNRCYSLIKNFYNYLVIIYSN